MASATVGRLDAGQGSAPVAGRVDSLRPCAPTPRSPISTPPDRHQRVARIAAWVLPALLALFFVWILNPVLLTLRTTPTGYDLGAHLVPLREAITRLLPTGRLHGWSHGWFAGYPLYYFYFPLPALLTGLLSTVLSFEVATKLMSVAGIVLLPFGALALARGLGLAGWKAGLLAVATAAMGLMQSNLHLGGNLTSTLAGEFSYGLSFTLSLVYLGLVLRAADRERAPSHGVLAGIVLALVALSHVITTFAVVVASAPLLAQRRARRPVLVSWGLGFALAGWWTVPFLLRWPYLPHYAWDFPRSLAEVVPPELLPLFPVAGVGAWLLARRRPWALAVLAGAMVAALGFYLHPVSSAFPGRVLPYWFLAVHVLAGWAGIVALETWLTHRHTPRRAMVGLVGAGAVAVAFALVEGARDTRPLREWAQWNYSGFEAKEAPWDLVRSLGELPPGRIDWEDNAALLSYGTPHAFTLLPYWTSHAVLGGLLIESSLTGPFYLRIRDETSPGRATRRELVLPKPHPTDYASGFRHLALFGVPWYVAISPEARTGARAVPGVEEVLDLPTASVFHIPDAELVTVAAREPVVLESGDFMEEAIAWFDGGGREGGPLLARDGPSEWVRVANADEALARSETATPGGFGPDGAVSAVTLGPEAVSFHTTAVGRPHLVKVSYFPNWRAEGADGPWWVAPSLMLVVPTSEDVRLVFRPAWVERLGLGLTVAGVLVVAGAGALALRAGGRGPRRRSTYPS